MPTINLDSIAATLPAWDLTIHLDGKDLRVRRLNGEDIQKLMAADLLPNAEAAALVGGWFEGEKPDVLQWSADTITAVTSVVLAYYRQTVRAHRQDAIENAVKLAINCGK